VKHRIVVLEGPDGSGKSRLAADIQKRLGYEVRHEGPPPAGEDPYRYYLRQVFDTALLTFTCPGVVLDRFALGDRVYGPVLRGEDRLGAENWRKIREGLDWLGALRVLCMPPLHVCLTAWRARARNGQEMISHEDRFRATYDAWNRFYSDEGQVAYDWTRDSREALLSLIEGPEAEEARLRGLYNRLAMDLTSGLAEDLAFGLEQEKE